MKVSVPYPSISLIEAITAIAIKNPNPTPIASTMDNNGLFLEANPSALPSTIQLTTINDRNIPNCSAKLAKYAFISISIIVTNVAIITIYTGILISLGTIFLIREIVKLEKLEISEEEIEKEIATAKEAYGIGEEDLYKQLGSKEVFRYNLLMKKVMELVTKN